MKRFVSLLALFALLLTPLGVSAQTLGNNAYFPQFPNLIKYPIALPRRNVKIPYIEVIRADPKTGITRYYNPSELTQADLKYTRIPRYNPATLFPNVALDLTRNRAGGPVPVVNYHRQMVLDDNCVNLPVDEKAPSLRSDLGAFSGMPIIRTAPHQFYYPSAEVRGSAFAREDKTYIDGCWMQRVIDSAVVYFRFSKGLYPNSEYARVIRRYIAYNKSLENRLNNLYYHATSPPDNYYANWQPFFFSKSAKDPLFAVVAAHPGMDEVIYSPSHSAVIVPFFLLTLDPSNLCALVPDQKGAPFAMCGFDLNAPPMIFVALPYQAIDGEFPSPVDPFPSYSNDMFVYNGVMAPGAVFLPGGNLSADLYRLLLRSYPHYFLARGRADGAKFIREHSGARYVQTYAGALIAAQRVAARQVGAPPTSLSAAKAHRATGSSSRLLTPYTSGVQQTFSSENRSSKYPETEWTIKAERWFGADYAVVAASANKLGRALRNVKHEQHFLFDYRNNAVFELSAQDGYACKFLAQSTLNPLLNRPDVIANFAEAHKPVFIYPLDHLHRYLNEPLGKLSTTLSEKGLKVVYDERSARREAEVRISPAGLSPLSAQQILARPGIKRTEHRYEAREAKEPLGFPYDVAKKVEECRQSLPRGGVEAVLKALMTRTDKVVGYELVSYYSAARVYFAGTPKEWTEAMQAAFRVDEKLDATLTLPNGARLKFFGHEPKAMFDAQGNRVDGIVVTFTIS